MSEVLVIDLLEELEELLERKGKKSIAEYCEGGQLNAVAALVDEIEGHAEFVHYEMTGVFAQSMPGETESHHLWSISLSDVRVIQIRKLMADLNMNEI